MGEGASGRIGDLCASRLKKRPWSTHRVALSPSRPFAHSPTRQSPLTNHFSLLFLGLRLRLAAFGATYSAGVVSR